MPDTDILTEEQVAKVAETVEANYPLRLYLSRFGIDVSALCRTLRAAWARVVELENERETDLIGRLGRQAADYLEECERLREQLAQYEQCVTCVACGRPSWHRKGDEPL